MTTIFTLLVLLQVRPNPWILDVRMYYQVLHAFISDVACFYNDIDDSMSKKLQHCVHVACLFRDKLIEFKYYSERLSMLGWKCRPILIAAFVCGTKVDCVQLVTIYGSSVRIVKVCDTLTFHTSSKYAAHDTSMTTRSALWCLHISYWHEPK